MANPRTAGRGGGERVYRQALAAQEREDRDRERSRRVSRTIADLQERDRTQAIADAVVDRLQVRAVSDVTTTDVMGARYAPAPLASAWPTVDALNMGGRLAAVSPTRYSGPESVTLPTPTPTLVATKQTMEKAAVGSGVPDMGVEMAPWDTYGIAVDLALQADGARDRVQAWLDAAVAQAIDRALLAGLTTAAGLVLIRARVARHSEVR